jgi:hypothetical protein
MTVSGVTSFRGKVRFADNFTGNVRARSPIIAYVGDNLTYGTGGTRPYGSRVVPNTWNGLQPANRTFAAPGYTIPQLFNQSELGQQNHRTGATLSPPNYLHSSMGTDFGLNIAVVWAGTNDIASGTPVGTAYSSLIAYMNNIRSRGWSTIVCTMISRNGFDTQKNQLNALISAGWTSFAGGYCNLAGVPQLGADGAYANTTYFNTDGINLTDSGYILVAQTVQPVVNGMIAGATTGFTSINSIASALIFGG